MLPIRRPLLRRRRNVRMKANTLLTLSLLAAGTLVALPAYAGWSVQVSLGGPAYYPAPLIVAPPCPPPRVVYAPPLMYYPPPRAYCAPVVYAPPYPLRGRYGYDSGYRDDRRHDNHPGRGHDRQDRR